MTNFFLKQPASIPRVFPLVNNQLERIEIVVHLGGALNLKFRSPPLEL